MNFRHTMNFDEHELSVPFLPDDLMLMIFGEITTTERVSLGTSCKRFRAIDFELGKKSFNKISLEWTPNWQKVEMEALKTRYAIHSGYYDPLDPSKHNVKILRHAHTTALTISIDDRFAIYGGNISTDIEYFTHLFKNVRYKEFRIFFNTDQDCSDNPILAHMIQNRNLENALVYLSFQSSSASHNIQRTRERLMNLPKIDRFRLDWFSNHPVKASHNLVLDDATLLHIIMQTNHADLCEGNITVQGVLGAFELMCQSNLDFKFVMFTTQKSVIAELLDIALPYRVMTVGEDALLIDYQRLVLLRAVSRPEHFIVQIYKMRKSGNGLDARCREVKW